MFKGNAASVRSFNVVAEGEECIRPECNARNRFKICFLFLSGERPSASEKDKENAWAGTTVENYKFDTEDSACGFFRFENGATLYFDTSWSFNGPIENATMVVGDKAGATMDPFKIFRGDGMSITEEIPEGDFAGNFFELEIAHFIDCVRTGKTPSSDIEQAVQLEAMLAGIYDSAKKGKEIKLKY